MADKNSKAAQNVAGKYYVDVNCIGCGQCIDLANDFFADGHDGGVYVKKQPASTEDMSMCEKALSGCPVEAIGNDGQ
jgi:ferredoxin